MYFKVDRESGKPIFEQIKERIKDFIASGSLKPGELLPSVRKLASVLRVNVNTVVRAYRELVDEGYVESRWGYGFTVRGVPSEESWLRGKRKEFETVIRSFLDVGISLETLMKWLEDMRGDRDAGGRGSQKELR